MRQVDLAALHQRPGGDTGRRGPLGRRARVRPRGGPELAAPGGRHRLPELQPLPAHDRPRERDAGSAEGPQVPQGLQPRPGHDAPRARRPRGEGPGVPRSAVGRATAAGRHRPGPRHGPAAAAARRDHLCTRPGARGRGAEHRSRPGPGGHDDDAGHARDGLRREVASKVCFLDGGVVAEEGPPERIFSEPENARTQTFLRRIIEARRL